MILRMLTISLLLSACATKSITEKDIIKKVSLDKKCPRKKVKVLKQIVLGDQGSYHIEACDKLYNYNHIGRDIFETNKGRLNK